MRATLTRTDVAAGETVVRQGDEGRRFYLVEAGALDVILTSEDGLRLPVARLGPGSHFGEMSLLGGTPVSADVVASEPSILYAAAPEEFDEL
jgi:CRP-like cAMP-binding protein